MRRVAFLVLFCLTASAVACSGPGAQAGMARAEMLSKVQVAYAALAFIASLIMRFKGLRHDVAPVVLGFLTLSHPTWWENPYRGDCGMTLQFLSLAYTFFATLTLCWHIRAARKRA